MPERSMLKGKRPIALVGVVVLSTLLAMPASALERMAEGLVEAKVIGVVPIRAPGRGTAWRARVTLQLDEGTRIRLTYHRPHPRVGERVQLRLTDGEFKPVRPPR